MDSASGVSVLYVCLGCKPTEQAPRWLRRQDVPGLRYDYDLPCFAAMRGNDHGVGISRTLEGVELTGTTLHESEPDASAKDVMEQLRALVNECDIVVAADLALLVSFIYKDTAWYDIWKCTEMCPEHMVKGKLFLDICTTMATRFNPKSTTGLVSGVKLNVSIPVDICPAANAGASSLQKYAFHDLGPGASANVYGEPDCTHQVRLVAMLERARGLIATLRGLELASSVPAQELAFHPHYTKMCTQMMETKGHELFGDEYRLNSSRKRSRDQKDHPALKGGVKCICRPLGDNQIVHHCLEVDFKSAYPNVTVGNNIDQSTYSAQGEHVIYDTRKSDTGELVVYQTDHAYSKERVGVAPALSKELSDMRALYTKRSDEFRLTGDIQAAETNKAISAQFKVLSCALSGVLRYVHPQTTQNIYAQNSANIARLCKYIADELRTCAICSETLVGGKHYNQGCQGTPVSDGRCRLIEIVTDSLLIELNESDSMNGLDEVGEWIRRKAHENCFGSDPHVPIQSNAYSPYILLPNGTRFAIPAGASAGEPLKWVCKHNHNGLNPASGYADEVLLCRVAFAMYSCICMPMCKQKALEDTTQRMLRMVLTEWCTTPKRRDELIEHAISRLPVFDQRKHPMIVTVIRKRMNEACANSIY